MQSFLEQGFLSLIPSVPNSVEMVMLWRPSEPDRQRQTLQWLMEQSGQASDLCAF